MESIRVVEFCISLHPFTFPYPISTERSNCQGKFQISRGSNRISGNRADKVSENSIQESVNYWNKRNKIIRKSAV